MSESYPIETAPENGEFLAEDKHGDWLRATRYANPFGNPHTVISNRTGRWWSPQRWMPLPTPPEAEA